MYDKINPISPELLEVMSDKIEKNIRMVKYEQPKTDREQRSSGRQ